jgi:putative transposase
MGSHEPIREWFIQFAQYYNFYWPYQSLGEQTSVEGLLIR